MRPLCFLLEPHLIWNSTSLDRLSNIASAMPILEGNMAYLRLSFLLSIQVLAYSHPWD